MIKKYSWKKGGERKERRTLGHIYEEWGVGLNCNLFC
jgi:hypothetical protein